MGDFKPFVNLCQVTFWILANFPGLVIYFLVAGVWSLSCLTLPSAPRGLQHTRLLSPWDFPGKSTGVVSTSFSIVYFY